MHPLTPSPSAQPQQWFTLREAGTYGRFGETKLRELVKDRQIKHTRLPSGDIRFKREWLDDYLESLALEVVDVSAIGADMFKAHSPKRRKAALPISH